MLCACRQSKGREMRSIRGLRPAFASSCSSHRPSLLPSQPRSSALCEVSRCQACQLAAETSLADTGLWRINILCLLWYKRQKAVAALRSVPHPDSTGSPACSGEAHTAGATRVLLLYHQVLCSRLYCTTIHLLPASSLAGSHSTTRYVHQRLLSFKDSSADVLSLPAHLSPQQAGHQARPVCVIAKQRPAQPQSLGRCFQDSSVQCRHKASISMHGPVSADSARLL